MNNICNYVYKLDRFDIGIDDLIKKIYTENHCHATSINFYGLVALYEYSCNYQNLEGQHSNFESIPKSYLPHLRQKIEDNFNEFGDTKTIDDISSFNPYIIDQEYVDQIKSKLPKFINAENIQLTLNKITNGSFLQVHRDANRKSSLFYLLTEPNVETRWYTLKPEIAKKFNSPIIRMFSPYHVDLQHKEVVQSDTWYLFNNVEYHSAHKLNKNESINRASFHIDFIDLTYNQVLELLKDNNCL